MTLITDVTFGNGLTRTNTVSKEINSYEKDTKVDGGGAGEVDTTHMARWKLKGGSTC